MADFYKTNMGALAAIDGHEGYLYRDGQWHRMDHLVASVQGHSSESFSFEPITQAQAERLFPAAFKMNLP